MTLDIDVSSRLLLDMIRIRMVEERIVDLYPEQEMRCPVHLSIGQEAAAVGVCSMLNRDDWVFSGHRNHAHYLAKGGDLKLMLAELYGKGTGCCGGKGGSMHLTDLKAGFVGATPIVGSTVPIAVGAALTAQIRGDQRMVTVFFGDGAMETGAVHESINFASLKQLPIIFSCENNLYSVYSPLSVRQPGHRTISQLATGHGVTVFSADGNDLDQVTEVTRSALKLINSGKGPVFLEFSTYRWREHCGPNYDNNIGYRSEAEFLEWKKWDPVERLMDLVEPGSLDEAITEIEAEIDTAVDFAKNSPFPDPHSAADHVYA
jgi:pyruvate dehydrogenase E1 component alpha subunit|tara:strand:- start:13239 stop:14192 length:954 start_codon:yes stop_codon:yes gene_type:complete